ncbi:MAG: DUF1080 domain-containing protein [Gemmatimonadaceae bacterium]|nr:DUF1080 domain-containing protein [Gemmatimonadaceae bacterium]
MTRLPLATIALALIASSVSAQSTQAWRAHDPERPKPPVVTPAETLGQPPSDAIVLFDGSNLDQWSGPDGQPAGWAIRDGYMETAPGAGPLLTRRAFGDAQLHIEFATPSRVQGAGQGRGNSGVILMGLYEVQVLDSYENLTYADGQAAAIYGQYPPLVNASRAPGAWQTYDIVFRRPRFGADTRITSPARLTVFHNGVLVQDAEPLWGPTTWLQHLAYKRHPDTLPLVLQDHDNPVRYRNIWIRPLGDIARPGGLASASTTVIVPTAVLRAYAGNYAMPNGDPVGTIRLTGGRLTLLMPGSPRERELVLVPITRDRFHLLHTAGTVAFTRSGRETTMRLRFAEIDRVGTRR